MTIPSHRDHPPGIIVTLPEIYDKVLQTDDKLDKLAISVEQMVAVNKRLDQHHDRLNDHGSRLATLETSNAIAASRTRAPWWIILGAITGIISALGVTFAIIAALGKISAALG